MIAFTVSEEVSIHSCCVGEERRAEQIGAAVTRILEVPVSNLSRNTYP
jgi:hypothetical protein